MYLVMRCCNERDLQRLRLLLQCSLEDFIEWTVLTIPKAEFEWSSPTDKDAMKRYKALSKQSGTAESSTGKGFLPECMYYSIRKSFKKAERLLLSWVLM
jgi:hypothetical protein